MVQYENGSVIWKPPGRPSIDLGFACRSGKQVDSVTQGIQELELAPWSAELVTFLEERPEMARVVKALVDSVKAA